MTITAPDPNVPAAAQSAADRFGCSIAFARFHWGRHTCIDGTRYEAPCLFTDPAREAECRALLSGGAS
jgi:hypothetical protein